MIMAKMGEDDKEFRHESYGLVGFSRITGDSGRLFGSSLPNQHAFMRLRIMPGMRNHHLSKDWYHADRDTNGGRDYIEVDLSPSQFAELLTSMNMGDGVPCTIRRLDGRKIEAAPDELLESEQIREDFGEKTNELAKMMKGFKARMKEIFDKKTPVSQKDKEELRKDYDQVIQHVESNLPFVIDQFHKAAGKIITHAKAEVDAFLTHAVMAAGFKSIAEGKNKPPVLTLPEKEEK
jgi:hypothetical protein